MQTEKDIWFMNGLLGIVVEVILIGLFILNIMHQEYVFAATFFIIFFIILISFTSNKSLEAKRVLLFGKYLGTLRNEGLAVTIPFTKREKILLHTKFLEIVSEINPNIKIVLFYRIVDTAKAVFSTKYIENMIRLQSEMMVQGLLEKDTLHYVSWHEKNEHLKNYLNEKVKMIGIEIVETSFYDISNEKKEQN